MPRRPRKLYDKAWYHVMNRGANHQNIFFSLDDRDIFLGLLDHISNEYSMEIHAYCLMTNHFHLLAHTPKGNLDDGMRYLSSVYTMRINKKYERDGALFRGRYHAKNVEKDNYFIWSSKYIHDNPVDAGITDFPGNYPWSSYSAYIGKKEKPNWLHTDKILGCFGVKDQIKRYQTFCEPPPGV